MGHPTYRFPGVPRWLSGPPAVCGASRTSHDAGLRRCEASLFVVWTVIALSAIVKFVSTGQGVTRIFKGKSFERFVSANDIEDQDLVEAIERAENGLIDADLGAGLIKQRLARGGQGKSGGFRAVIFIRLGERAVFIHGFAKKDTANLTGKEVKQLKALAKIVLKMTDKQLKDLLDSGKYIEIQRKKE